MHIFGLRQEIQNEKTYTERSAVEIIYWHTLDLETGGLDPKTDEIAELALITICGSQIINIHHQYYSVSKMGEKAMEVNGLTITQLDGWPHFQDVNNINELRKLIKYKVYAHNASFDKGFMIQKGVFRDHPFVDTRILCKKSGKNLTDNKLQTWLKHYNLNNGTPHTAVSDAFNLARLVMLLGWQIHNPNM